jgi:hypothetical protein
VYYPILLTPRYCNGEFSGEYRQMRMADSSQPRLYHSSAILLPDARVLMVGGNTVRSTIHVDEPQADPARPVVEGQQPKPNLDRVERDLYFFQDGPVARGFNQAPSENWVGDIFSPPYLFIDGPRRAHIDEVAWLGSGQPSYQPNGHVGNKTFTLLHSQQEYRITFAPAGMPECFDEFIVDLLVCLYEYVSAVVHWQRFSVWFGVGLVLGLDQAWLSYAWLGFWPTPVSAGDHCALSSGVASGFEI